RIFEYDPALHHASYEIFLDIVHPDDRAMVDKVYTDSVKNRTPYIIVHRLLFPDRRVKFVREWCETFYDEAGRPLRSIGTTQDITEQQLAQEALRKSAEEIEDLYNNAPCGYHSLDKDGVIIRINDTLLHWLGYTRDELVAKVNVADLLSEDSRNVFRSRYPAFRERGFVHDIEYELIRKDGTLLPVALSSTAIYDSDGHFLMSRSTMFDITNRRLAEKKLAESEERFRTMADNAPIMIWIEDAQDQQVSRGSNFFNQRWHEFTGLTQEQTQGSSWQVNIHADDRKFYLDTYRNAFEKRKPFKMEYRLRRNDDVFCWIEDSGIPRFTADGEFLGYIGICVDVTEHKLFEKIRVEMEHMDRLNIAGEMASGLAHELSQPLNAASNYLDACLRRMAEDNWDHAALQKTVRLAHDQTERAGKIIGHLKDIVRKQKYERTMLDVNSVIRDSVKFLEYELHHHYISVTLDISTLPLVLANRIEIEQVMINLIKNAIESMSSSPRRELRITTRVIESGSILVTVSDTGEGVGLEDMEKIFNPFQSSKKDGLGLGLAICRSLIEEYGGKIWAEQKEDEGSEFNFTLACEVTHD
ncbi:MAG: PAS domain-containing protein, partial [Sideroxydans sp.]